MLRLDGVTKRFDDGTQALSAVSLEVRTGEILALVGASGCGKTTLLRVIAGLETASSGVVTLDGRRIDEPHPEIGLVFQEPRLLPWLNVAANVAFGLRDRPRDEREDRVAAILSRVGLTPQRHKLPRDLSGGQQQRAALARALAVKPKVLLLDEPFSALDAMIREDLQDHLLDLWRETAPTIVLVTHDIDEAAVLADRIAILAPHPGRIAETIVNPLSRPRDRTASGFVELRRRLRLALGQGGTRVLEHNA